MNTYAERAEKAASERDKTGIPRKMKNGFERSSGFSFDDVRVHYNSEKPAQLCAHAYTQGNEVYVAPGQEKHLPHELGHVVQQKSDTVKPTGEIGGLPLNDDTAMENGADMIAKKAENIENLGESPVQAKAKDGIVQRADETPASAHAYNWSAGPVSTILTGLGMLGGIGSFLYSKHAERKHRYIEEVEKYSDAACDASEDLLAVPIEGNVVTPKAKKLQFKVARNFEAAIKKANASGEDINCAGDLSSGLFKITVSGNIDNTKEKNIKNALIRAKNAYETSVNLLQGTQNPNSGQTPAQGGVSAQASARSEGSAQASNPDNADTSLSEPNNVNKSTSDLEASDSSIVPIDEL